MRTLLKTKLSLISLAVGASLACSSVTLAQQHDTKMSHDTEAETTIQKWQGEAYQGWLDGKVETALLLNKNLNPFKINTQTSNNVVTLSGSVSTEVESDLAEEIAIGVSGVDSVVNNLSVNPDTERHQENMDDKSFSQHWDDASITAAVKSKLLLEDSVKGLQIDVDTNYSVVTLTGKVDSSAAHDLAVQIAENTESVKSVEDNLSIGQ